MSGIKRWHTQVDGSVVESVAGTMVLVYDHEAEVARLRAELADAHAAIESKAGWEWKKEADRLRAEVEAYRKDAGRWQHARKLLTIDDIAERQKILEAWNNLVSDVECERADEAIDAAMGASA